MTTTVPQPLSQSGRRRGQATCSGVAAIGSASCCDECPTRARVVFRQGGRKSGWLNRVRIKGVPASLALLLATSPRLLASPDTTYETGGGPSAIYADSFSGSASASLHGKTTTHGGGVWGNYDFPNLQADGGFSGTFQNTLPVTITGGNIYELRSHITFGGTDGWGGITFSGNANPVWSAFSPPYFGTILTVGEIWPKNAANLANLGTGDYTIRLDTTRPDWSVSYYFNGVLGDSYSWTNGNPSITHAGLVGYDGSSGGKFDRFSFTKTDPAALYAVSRYDAADVSSGAAAVWSIQSGEGIFGSSLAKINDGKFIADAANRDNSAECFVPADGTVVSVTFPDGADILSVITYAASGSGQVRSGQNYTLEYAKTNSSEFMPLVDYLNVLDPQNIDAPSTSTKVSHAFTPGVLRDVGTLRFTFHNVGAGDGETMYREIDVTTLADGSPFRFQGTALEPGIAAELDSWIQALNLSEVSYQDYQRIGNWDYSILPKQQDETLGVQVTGEDSQRGFILYSRPAHELIFPHSKPRSRVTEVQVSAALGEYKPVSIGIWNMIGASSFRFSATPLTNTASGEQIPPENVEFRSTVMLPQLQSERGVYFRFPAALERNTEIALPSGESGQFWLTMHVPASTTPGTYTSNLTVSGSGGGTATVPVILTVLPFQLDEAAVDLSMCFLIEDYPELYPENLDLYMGDMKAHGLNSLWSWPIGHVTMTPSGLQADFTRASAQAPGTQKFAHSFQETMEAYRRAGFTHPWIYGSLDSLLLILYHAGRADPEDPNSALAYVVDYTSQLRAFSQQNRYPEFDLLLIDEPGLYPGRLASTVQLHANMHAAFPQQRMVLDCAPTSDEDLQLAVSLDSILYADPNLVRKDFCDQNSIDFGNYNSGSGGRNPLIDRFCHGFWAVKAELQAVSNWVYAWRYSPHLPGNRYVFPASDGPVPTPAWEAVRVGIYDQRYLLTFQRLVDELSRSDRQDVRGSVANLQAQVDQLLAPIPVDRSDRNGFLESYPQSGLEDIRQVLSSGIVQLLQLQAAEGAFYAAWAAVNAGGQTASLDWDNDGVPNGVEFFMNVAPGFTANPAVVGGAVTWPNGGNMPSSAYGTQFVVQRSADLVNWNNVPERDPNLSNNAGSVSYILTGADRLFVRFKVLLD